MKAWLWVFGLSAAALCEASSTIGARDADAGLRLAQNMNPPVRHAPPSAKAKTAPAQRVDVRGPLTPALGASQAKITIISFSDYYCPYCRTLSTNLEQVLDKYPDKVRVVYRHFATSVESAALAEAALCASEQGRFGEYHRLIFSTRGVHPDGIDQLAATAGLDQTKFRGCIDSSRFESRVRDDIAEGERLQIEVTPTLFINGMRKSGLVSVDELSEIIDQMLR
jgi:protein-disulfide isomerase